MTTKGNPGVVYVADPKLLACSNAVPILKHRATLVHHLISAYGLQSKMKVVPSAPATEEEVRGFHSEEYVKFLQVAQPDDQEIIEDEFGLGFDCPVINNLWTIVCQVAGASLTAARALTTCQAKIAINWCGGWHHAQRDCAAGFCYVNDIVLAVRHLRTKFDKILYVDLDIHHGDGVENAFFFSPKVVTMSFHQLEAGFFPGTGKCKDTGQGGYNKVNTAKLWTTITSEILNIPISAEIPEHQFFPLYGPSFELEVTAGLRKSENTQKSLDETIQEVHGK
ncbi:histone deacetylase 8-like [Homarus americanus]|uniref:Histone deacetylase 8 n=1 Tax=Homarus americanus TaxID=6706 RepID=A0A8J5KJF8_HOMAM|nr:histone deacetylase 8-like [Homarus americanus]